MMTIFSGLTETAPYLETLVSFQGPTKHTHTQNLQLRQTGKNKEKKQTYTHTHTCVYEIPTPKGMQNF